MKIAASVKGSVQVGMETYQDYVDTYIFDSSQTIDEIMAITKMNYVCGLNLSDIKEAPK